MLMVVEVTVLFVFFFFDFIVLVTDASGLAVIVVAGTVFGIAFGVVFDVFFGVVFEVVVEIVVEIVFEIVFNVFFPSVFTSPRVFMPFTAFSAGVFGAFFGISSVGFLADFFEAHCVLPFAFKPALSSSVPSMVLVAAYFLVLCVVIIGVSTLPLIPTSFPLPPRVEPLKISSGYTITISAAL
jgi:hypothetical protein